jgi:hypothetical protein
VSASYVERLIDITITLGNGSFGNTGMNTAKLSNLRTACTIHKAGFPSFDTAELRIYGVTPTIMNTISTLGIYSQIMARVNNTVLIEAGDATNGMSIVYFGSIINAYAVYDGAPETFLQIIGGTGQLGAMKPVPPTSYPGTADVATIMANLAASLGYKFENDGVTTKLASPYFPGTALEQAHNVARAANIELYIDSGSGTPTLAIWPKTGTRTGQVPLISAANGSLVNYPQFYSQGMAFRCLYNPNLRIGGQIRMQSTVGSAPTQAQATGTQPTAPEAGGPNGLWYMVGLSYDLSSQLPGGPWFCDCQTARVNVPPA